MIEVAAKSKVFDIIHPTPESLEELSAIAVSVELWRQKVKEFRGSPILKKFDPFILRKQNTWIKDLLPYLPITIYKTIEKYCSEFGQSMRYWLQDHYKKVFCFNYSHQNYVLEDFDDFACDYDGTIHCVRTAERMMRYVGWNTITKFVIACTYFFEDDVRRMWPVVSRSMNLDDIDFEQYPELYYWICCLRNELDMVPISRHNNTIDEEMFEHYFPDSKPCVEYFWNRIPLENRIEKAIEFAAGDNVGFVRFIIQKLDNQQLDEFLNRFGSDLMDEILRTPCFDERIVLRTWLYIRNFLKEDTFVKLVMKMLIIEPEYDHGEAAGEVVDELLIDVVQEAERFEYLCRELWNTTPQNFKRSVIRNISRDETFLKSMGVTGDIESYELCFEVLSIILHDASSEEKNSFWNHCWHLLIAAIPYNLLQIIMELCFKNKDEITDFMEKVLIGSQNVHRYCISLFDYACFDNLNDFVKYLCPEILKARNFKQQLLLSALLNGERQISFEIVDRIKELNEFIDSAYDSVDSSANFKTQLMSSPLIHNRLSHCIFLQKVNSEKLIEFIDTLAPTEQIVSQIKLRIIESLREYVTTVEDHDIFTEPWCNTIFLWCFGSENVHRHCISLLSSASFGSLNDYVSSLYPGIQAARNFKQQLLWSALLSGECEISPEIVDRIEEFNEFIDSAYNNADLSANFKNQLMLSPLIQNRLSHYEFLRDVSSKKLIEFIDTFVSSEQAVEQIETRIIESLREYATTAGDHDIFSESWLNRLRFFFSVLKVTKKSRNSMVCCIILKKVSASS